jgi:SWI/SNF-related matrix-associated actin-dependent regulator 1 of chromatin subfamily A
VNLKKKMYHFQEGAVAYNMLHGNAINGDQQGLGKTIETIATVQAMDLFPCLVITKKSLISNWEAEWKDWTDRQVLPFTPSKKETWPFFFSTGLAEVGIINYESLQQFFVEKIEQPVRDDGTLEPLRVKHIKFKESTKIFKSIIIDESHYVKDGNTKRTKFCIGITRHLTEKGVYLLTGTPVLNDPMELYTQLLILNRAHLFGTYSQFNQTYSGKQNKGNLKELNYYLHKHCYFRRLKTEVKSDLPAKTRSVVLCDITNRDDYNLAEQEFVKYLKEKMNLTQGQIDRKMRGEVMVQMALLKKIAAQGKMSAVKEWMESLVDQEEKMVLFGYHKEITEKLASFFPARSVRLCGTSKTPQELQQKKHLFQTDPKTCICICSLSADAEGHTLNAASNLGMVELPWHFGKAEQIEDRIHRINNWLPANIFYFLADKTIDRDIYKLIMDKKDMHEKVTGTEDDIEERVIDHLINLFTQR